MQLTDTIKLSSGHSIPRIGFGVYKSPAEVTSKSVQTALESGYTHIDSAQYYANEKEVGDAIRSAGVARESVFVTTKIIAPESSDDATYKSLTDSVDKINLGYVDLFLIHTPSTGPEKRKSLWKALEKLQKAGLAKSIGVSNYGVKHLEQMKDYATVQPVLNQIEIHPWCQQKDIVAYCKDQGIAIEAYCPIVRNQKANDPTLSKIATKHKKDTAQILIRWSLQKGYIPLPKSDTPSRIKSNAEVFDFQLDEEDMKALDDLDEGLGAACAPQAVNCE